MSTEESFAGWAILELMGHRKLGGFVQEQEIAGQGFLRIDVFGPDEQPIATQLYSPSAVYCLTPTTEEIARLMGPRYRPAPVTAYDLRLPETTARPAAAAPIEAGDIEHWADEPDDDDLPL